MAIFNNINPSNQGTQDIFPFFFITFKFPRQCLYFWEYRFYTFLVKFIPWYFILFSLILNGIVPWIFFSDSSLLVYTKATDLCKLITEFCLLTYHRLTECLFFLQPWSQQSLCPMNPCSEAKIGKISMRCSEK